MKEEKKLRDKGAAVPNPTTPMNISDLSWLKNTSGLINNFQIESGMEIPQEQVGSSEVTVKSATVLERWLVTPIADTPKSLQVEQESKNHDSGYKYVEIEVDVIRQLSPRN